MMRRCLPELLLGLLVGAITFAVFARAMHGEFVRWDDDVAIVNNPLIRGLDHEHLDKMFLDLGQGLRYRPLIWLSWALIYSEVELKPFAYHLVPVLLHAANALLVFLLLRKLGSIALEPKQPDYSPRYFLICCAFGALLWALHPLRVEPVAWANGLPYGQTLFFLLLSLLSYLQARGPSATQRQRWFCYAVSVLMYAFSAFTYPVVLGFPLVLFVVDFYPLKRLTLGREDLRLPVMGKIFLEKLPFMMLSGVFVLLALYVRTHPTGHWQPAATIDRFGIHSRIMQAFYIWGYYVWRPWWPFDLSPIYMRLVSFDPADGIFLLSTFGVILLSGLLLWKRHRWPAILAVWTAYLILLVPVLGLTEHPHFSSDRYSYIPGIGWSVLALGLLMKLRGAAARIAGLVTTVLIVGGLGVLSYRQVSVWHDTASLYQHTIKTLGDHPFRYSFQKDLASYYKQQHDYPQALVYYSKVAARNPQAKDVHKNLGDVLLAMGEFDRAAQEYSEGLKFTPDDANLYCGLGQVLAAKGDVDGATTNLVRALELNPRLASAHRSLGELLKQQGKLSEAQRHFDQAAEATEVESP